MVKQSYIFLSFILLVVGSTFAQDPQSNRPDVLYPLLDNYIKEGYDRNLRTHTRNLGKIDYVYVVSIKKYLGKKEHGYVEYGNTATFKVYRYWHDGYKDYRYQIAFNIGWVNNYIALRRMFYKTMGLTSGLRECHDDCEHIMSKRPMFDPHLYFFDLVEGNWEKELDTLFKLISDKG